MNQNDPATHLYYGFRQLTHTFEQLSQNAAIPEMVRGTYQQAAQNIQPFLTGYEMIVEHHLLRAQGPRMTALRDAAQWLGVELSDEKKSAMAVKLEFASEELLERYDTDRAMDRWSQLFMHAVRIGDFEREEPSKKGQSARYTLTKEWTELDGLAYKLKYVAAFKQDPDDPFDPEQKVFIDHVECIYETVHKYWTCALTIWRSNALFTRPSGRMVVTNLVENITGYAEMKPDQLTWFVDWIVAEHGLRQFNVPLTSTILRTPGRPSIDIMDIVRDWLHRNGEDNQEALLDRLIGQANNLGLSKGLSVPFGEHLSMHITTGRAEWYNARKYREDTEKYQYWSNAPLLQLAEVNAGGVDVKNRAFPHQWPLMMEEALIRHLDELADEYHKSKKK